MESETAAENKSNCHLRQFLRLLLFSPSILSKRRFSEQQESRLLQLANAKTHLAFKHIVQNAALKGETRTVKIVSGLDYLLQDNEQLNYRRERSFLRNIKRLPVRSEKLSRRNQFLPPPRGKAEPLAHTKHQRFVPTKTISICSHQEVILYFKNILF